MSLSDMGARAKDFAGPIGLVMLIRFSRRAFDNFIAVGWLPDDVDVSLGDH